MTCSFSMGRPKDMKRGTEFGNVWSSKSKASEAQKMEFLTLQSFATTDERYELGLIYKRCSGLHRQSRVPLQTLWHNMFDFWSSLIFFNLFFKEIDRKKNENSFFQIRSPFLEIRSPALHDDCVARPSLSGCTPLALH